jgi:hypothetical protein
MDGRFSDRIYLSFHSNAAGGRGALGLWARDPAQRPDYQELLADLIGRTVNVGFLQESLPGLPPWARRTRHQLNHITFGELRRDFIQNEMSATILETAFFDQPDDARWLTDPRALTLFGQASLAALIEWVQAQERPGQPVLLPPPAPEQVSAVVDGQGQIQVRFAHGRTGSVRGGQATAFLAELSRDGVCFGPPQLLGQQNATTVSIPASWATTTTVFLRIRGVNSSGNSLPSPVVAALRGGSGKPVLLVDASLTMDETLNAEQSEVFSRGPETRQTVQRVRPALLLESHRTVRLAQALADLQIPFSMVSPADLVGYKISPVYRAVIYDCGTALPDFQPMPTAVAGALHQYVSQGGRVLGIGNWLAQALAQDGADGASLLPRVFAAQALSGPVEFSHGVKEIGGSGRSFQLALPDGRLGSPIPADGLVPSNAGRLVLRWSGRGAGGAAVAGPGGVISAVSPAALADPSQIRDLLEVLLAAVGVHP